MPSSRLQLRFWGVRGSIPTPHHDRLGYGGNTSCLEVRYHDQPPIILDGGSGLRALGASFAAGGAEPPLGAHLFLTHFHWDHIQGIPFLPALHLSNSNLTFYAAGPAVTTRRYLRKQMEEPYFPIALPAVQARTDCRQLCAEGIRFGDLLVRPFALRHPGGCTGYRLETPEGVLLYATDHEHGDAEHDELLRREADDASILIYDAQYTPEEYATRRGWGHSTWLEGATLARKSGVKRLILFHHDPERTDSELDRIVATARNEFAATDAAREGDCLSL